MDGNLKKMETAELTIDMFDNLVIVTSTCLAAGTKITTADGSVKNIEDIVEGDLLLAFDHEAGRFISSAVLYTYQGEAPKRAFTLHFSNGATLTVTSAHDLFERESRKYVRISEKSAEQFIGKHFYSFDDQTFVELTKVIYETKPVEYYEIYTAKCLNIIANGMLNVADDVDYLLNIYEFDENLTANAIILKEDIRKYGFFPYSASFGMTEKEFYLWNSHYTNIALKKDLISHNALYRINDKYRDQCNAGETSKSA